ncbi:hypothetical protein E5335_10160 [Coriobacteriaceae bacterium]|jgi:hypothetical protein|uniref:Uncharacterized protein n=1 Tax=Granulimonas faecalis TaxID=2894155 RepID=A0AAV5B5K8_9ACTN|nr:MULTISPECIES: hypothetical protein [Atopobiaceae]MBF0599204.1 hypothetical protein [Atopobiaceae bacterium FL090493]TGY57755.1 hypothetical protein E5335_10160 [Coriobacteriaceae bacterium]GJM55638.1 hypothetical protein ATOP_12930 [Granulimonas faecalis]
MTERTARCLSEGLFWLLALTGLGECVQGNVAIAQGHGELSPGETVLMGLLMLVMAELLHIRGKVGGAAGR